jgi:hypothetical protein
MCNIHVQRTLHIPEYVIMGILFAKRIFHLEKLLNFDEDQLKPIKNVLSVEKSFIYPQHWRLPSAGWFRFITHKIKLNQIAYPPLPPRTRSDE